MNILKLLIIPFIVILFTACSSGGSDADGNGTPANSALVTNAESFSSTAIDGNITLAVTSLNVTDISITMENIKLLADSYAITITSITPPSITFNKAATSDLSFTKIVKIAFTYTSIVGTPNINLNDIKLSYRKVVTSKFSNTTVSTNELDEKISLQSTISNPTENPNNILALSAYAPVTTISTAKQSIGIIVQVNDLNTTPAKPGVGEILHLETIHPSDGDLDSFSKVSDGNGRVTFMYTSPELPKYGTTLDLTIYSDKNPDIKKVITITFIEEVENVVANMYLAPSDFIITSAGEEKTIKIVTVDSEGVGINTNITIEQLTDTNNVDYGSFNTNSISTDTTGTATIVYKAPSDITGLSDKNITFTEVSTGVEQTLQVKFSEIATVPQVSLYEINAIVPSTISVGSTGTFEINIHKVGSPNILIPSIDVKDVNISTQFIKVLTLGESNYKTSSSKTINLLTHSLSGTAVVVVSASIFDGTKDVVITKNVPITVFSGPVATVSLFYVSTARDETLGVFKDTYTSHSVDKYSNPVNTGAQLFPTLINGMKTVSNNGKILVDRFEDLSASFSTDVDIGDNDKLIILPSVNTFDKVYLGGWSIESVTDNNNLILSEAYTGSDTSSLHYVIGNERRYLDGVAVASVNSVEDVMDENGLQQFVVSYDPRLVGHTFALSVVATDDNNRSGVGLRSNFKGLGYSYIAQSVDNDGSAHTSTISVVISPSNIDPLIAINIVPSSVSVSPEKQCSINEVGSNFTTDNNGRFTVIVNTEGNTTASEKCNVSWVKNNSSMYYEY